MEAQRFPVRRSDDAVRGTAPGSSGNAYVIAFANDRPEWGLAVNVTPELGRELTVTADLLPPLGNREVLRAYFYPGPLSRGA
jgi:hypothetical protein